MQAQTPRAGLIAALAVAVLFVALAYLYAGSSTSADFKALWLAATALAEGRPDLVYPQDSTHFTMLPPPEWVVQLAAEGYSDDVFPYLYPPLWVWLGSHLVGLADYETVLALVRPLNVALMLGMLALARRMAAPDMSLALYWLAGVALLSFTTVGFVPLYQGQPQILVAFLTVLAFERAERRQPWLAGACLALAAALKVFPALFVLVWLASGHTRAAKSFLAFGAALGLASVFLAGWPLHRQFLHMLAVISDTALVTKLCYTWESVLAAYVWPDALTFIPEPLASTATGTIGWFVLAKPPLLAAVARLLQLAALILVLFIARREWKSTDRAFLWPFAAALLTLTGPIGWSYYYLTVFAFLPALLTRLDRWGRIGLCALALVFLSPVLPLLLAGTGLDPVATGFHIQFAGTFTLTVIAFAFLAALRGRTRHAAQEPPGGAEF